MLCLCCSMGAGAWRLLFSRRCAWVAMQAGGGVLMLLLLLMGPAWAQPHATEQRYVGMCDASAAVDMGQGLFVVADDEKDVLQIYRYGQSQPVAALDLADFLGNRKPSGKPSEADLEGAARIGDRIYWIGSHGRTSRTASVDEHRWRFFATHVVATPQGPVLQAGPGRAFTGLLASWMADARYEPLLRQAATQGPKEPGGLNIEGLAATPAGGLLIGFRNPQPQGLALVALLHNPAAVVEQGSAPQWGAPVLLDLGGRGIRSVEGVGAGYLISAGPAGDGSPKREPAFALYRWSGRELDAPVMVQALPRGYRFEALFWVDERQELMLLSDDGTEAVGGRACKDRKVPAPDKSFRAIRLPAIGR
jgi:Protein of unknown function (DUF3616)